MTPEEYGERIIANTKGPNRNQYFPAQAYAALADFLDQNNPPTPLIGHAESSSPSEPFVVLHDLDSKSHLHI